MTPDVPSASSEERIRSLERRLADAEGALRAVAAGAVDTVCAPGQGHVLLRQAQDALIESQARYRRLVTRLSAVVFELTPAGLTLFVNEAAAPVLGYQPEELTGRCWWQTFFGGAQRASADALLARFASGDVVGHELPFTARSGAQVVLELSTANHYDEAGALARVVGFGVDITPRLRAQDALRESERRFHELADAMPQIVWSARPDGILDYYNVRWYELTGMVAGDEDWSPWVHPDDLPRVATRWTAAVLAGSRHDVEFRLRDHKSGVYRWQLTRALPVRDEAGAITRWYGTCTDIDDHKRAEARLRAQQREQQLILDSAPSMIWLKDDQNRILRCNRRAAEVAGVMVKDMEGRRAEDFFPGEAAKYLADDLDVLRSGAPRLGIVEPIVSATGERSWVSTDKVPQVGEDGPRIVVYSTDVTPRVRAEALLAQQVSRIQLMNEVARAIAGRGDLYSIVHTVLRYLEDKLPVDVGCVYLLDRDPASVTLVARRASAAASAGEFPPEGSVLPAEAIGLTACLRGELVYVEDVERARGGPPSRLGGGPRSFVGVPLVVEERVLGVLVARRTGVDAFAPEERAFLATLGEHVALAVHQARLHSELRTAYQELRSTQEQVVRQERLRALGQMASGIAHDFNNALAPVVGFSDLLLSSPRHLADGGTLRKYLEMIHASAQDGARVVSRLREFYRHREEGESLESVSLDAVVADTVAMTRPRWEGQAQASGANVRVETLPGGVTEVQGSETDLRQVLTNLIFNGVDAMPGGGTLTIRTLWRGHDALLEVTDTGTGMTPEVQRRCLEPFFTTKGEHGTGLGLAMVHGIVRRHEGSVEIQSELGKGTTVRISLPARAPVAPREANARTPLLPGKPLRVLVVDDNEQVRLALTALLELDAHAVEAATDGVDALPRFVAGKFDLVITDRAMPRMNGDQLTLALKGLAPDVKVIMLTGFGELMDSAGERPPGVDQVLAKPVTLVGLRAAVAAVVAQRSTPIRNLAGPAS